MLPQLPAIPLQSTNNSSDSTGNLNRLLPVGQNVSATVVAVSRDQIQPEIFRLKLEVNNRLIQMGVFQALPVGQKININRQSDGQIQIQVNPQPTAAGGGSRTEAPVNTAVPQPQTQPGATADDNRNRPSLQLSLPSNNQGIAEKIPLQQRIQAAVISSRPVYPAPAGNTPVTTPIQQAVSASTPQPATSAQNNPAQPQALNTASPSISNAPPQPATTATQTTAAPTAQPASSPATTTNTGNPPPTSQATNPPAAANTPAASAPTSATAGVSRSEVPTPPSVQPQGNPPAANNTQSAAQNTSTANQTSNLRPEVTPINNETRPGNQASAAERQPSAPPSTPSHHRITLALPDGSKVELNSPRPLPQGTQIQLQRTNEQTVQVVRLQEPPLSPASALDKPGVQEIMRNALPTQIPTGSAFNQLAQIATADSSQATQIGSVVRSMLQLFGVSPGSQEAPQQIRQNVELGGLHTERSMSQELRANTQDMKSQLQQLQQLADKLPEEQRERFEQILRGIHSRVTSQQIGSLQQWREQPDGSFERVLQLDLPIKQGEHWENLELRLSREGGANAAGEIVSVWRVRLHFDLDEQGGVDAEIRLTDGHEISTLFWCEQAETADKLRQRSDEFSERLRQCGFNNSEVTWHQGSAPEQKQVIQKQLVDLHT